MNAGQKLKALGEHYKIGGFGILTYSEKLAKLKDYTGQSSIDAMWSDYETETKKDGAKSIAVHDKVAPTNSSTAVRSSVQSAPNTQSGSGSFGRISDNRPLRGDIINASAPPVHINVASPDITVNYDITTWNYVLRETWKWTQAFLLGLAAGFFLVTALAARAMGI